MSSTDLRGVWHTQVLDVDHTGVAQTSLIDGDVSCIGDHSTVASLGNTQAVNGGSRCLGDGVVKLLAGGIEANRDFLRKSADGFTF